MNSHLPSSLLLILVYLDDSVKTFARYSLPQTVSESILKDSEQTMSNQSSFEFGPGPKRPSRDHTHQVGVGVL